LVQAIQKNQVNVVVGTLGKEIGNGGSLMGIENSCCQGSLDNIENGHRGILWLDRAISPQHPCMALR
jgi:hypothetical protein